MWFRLQIPIYRAVIHQQVTARFGYFDEQFDEVAFGNINLKRELNSLFQQFVDKLKKFDLPSMQTVKNILK